MCKTDKMIFCTAEKFFNGYPFEVVKIAGRREYVQALHYHDYMQIWYVKRGQCVHWLDDIEYNLTKGDMFILPPGIPHKIISVDAQNMELVECGFLEDFISDKSVYDFNYLKPFSIGVEEVKPLFTLDGNTVKEVEKIFDEIVFEYEHKEKFFELYIKANILKLLSIIARKYNKSTHADKNNILKYRNVIMEVLDYVRKNSNKKIYIEDACKITKMTSSYFSYVFKQLTGQTFIEYLRSFKIANAKEMLLNSDKKISEISSEIGFDDPAYFDRVFKKEVGITPKQFRLVYNQAESDKTI